MKFRIVLSFPKIGMQVYEGEISNLIERAEELGFTHNGYNDNNRQREELQNQPTFSGLYGPMWDGDAIRYEQPEAYTKLSN